MNAFLKLLAIEDRQEVSHVLKDKKNNTVRLVLNDDTEFEITGDNFEEVCNKVLADYEIHIAARAAEEARNDKLAEELLKYVEENKLLATFVVDTITVYEIHPSTVSATAHLDVGDKVFHGRFNYTNRDKMHKALIAKAHAALVKQ